MKKILVYSDRWTCGGVEKLWISLLEFFDFYNFEIVILTPQKETDMYDDFLNDHNIKLIQINTSITKNPFKRTFRALKKMKKIFKEINPEILHLNVCNGTGFFYAKIAKKVGISNIIVHSHNTNIEHDKFYLKHIIHKLCQKVYSKYSSFNLACSRAAGQFMFGNKTFYVANNGINTSLINFSIEKRSETRRILNLNSTQFVLCSIGRFSAQKNVYRIIEIFSELRKKEKNSILLLIGDGEEKKNIIKAIDKLNLSKYVKLLGIRKDVCNILCASDAFIMTSFHEGLPVVGVEAQGTGIKCVFSNNITQELKIIASSCFMDLIKKNSDWADELLKSNKNEFRISNNDFFAKTDYNIRKTANYIQEIYSKM